MQDVIVTVGSVEEADDVVAVLQEAEENGLIDFAFNVKIQPAKGDDTMKQIIAAIKAARELPLDHELDADDLWELIARIEDIALKNAICQCKNSAC